MSRPCHAGRDPASTQRSFERRHGLRIKSAMTAVLLSLAGGAFAQSTPVGLWRSADDKTGDALAEIRIVDAGNGLRGKIERVLKPSEQPLCVECTDDRKGQPKLGMEIIRGGRKAETEEAWTGGKILDPENGREYTLRLVPLEGGRKLQVRGYLGPFYRTQVWTRLP
jgi:uncharacterized protein (DUF2147 family)